MSEKSIKIVLQGLLLSVVAVIPFIKTSSLYFPFVSGKVYLFRLLVLLALFFCVWLFLKYKKIQPGIKGLVSPYKNILVIGLLFFFLAQIFVSFFAVSPALAFFSTIERHDGVIQYGFWVLYFLMLVYGFRNRKDWKILFSVFITTAFLVSCYAWINFQNQARLDAVFGNPSYLAAYLIFAIGFCLIAFERKFFEGKFLNGALLACSAFLGLTIFFTQTRGVYLGLAGAVFLFCLLAILFLRKESKKLALLCAVVMAIGLASAGGLFLARETEFVKNKPLLGRITEVVNFWEVGSVRERVLNWQIAMKAFKEKPIFGYGPENFMVAFNKYYDYRIGRGDTWFDRVHNQAIESLATGGIVLFSFYLFLLASIAYSIFKISRREKILSFIMGSVFLAYIVQGLFLFDTLPVYLGLFPFLAFVVYVYNEHHECKSQEAEKENKFCFQIYRWQKIILIATALVFLLGIYTTVFDPYRTNASALQFLAYASQGYYKEARQFAEKSFFVKNPYTFWEVRKRIGWQLLDTLNQDKEFSGQEAKDLTNLYDFIVPELEKFIESRPFDPQINYVLSRIYRLGSQKLEKNDLEKAKSLLEKAFQYSDLRVEYYNEMSLVFLAQGKYTEGEALLKDYVGRVKSFSYFPYLTMGHYYYVAGKYDLVMDNYKKAKEAGYDFSENDGEYSRYIDSAQNTKNYQEIVDISLRHLIKKGPKADIYFNVALGYHYLGDSEKAKEFFLKALELDKEQYQKYEHFFIN